MKKVFKILTLIMLIITILKIGDTYAKYFSLATTDTLSQSVGKWEIRVNDMEIYEKDGKSVQFNIDNFQNFSNPNATPNKISPSSKGYVDIVINPEGTDVAVRYDIELNLENISSLAINVDAWLEMASGENTLVKTGENTYTGTISLADVKAAKTSQIRCYIEWNNDDESKNTEDSAAGSVFGTAISIPTTVTVTQYLGEDITPYVEETP